MFKLTLVAILVLGVNGEMQIGFRRDERLTFGDTNQSQRVTGGQDAKNGEFPHQVALYEHQSQCCGGVIISEGVVLTAAHCVLEGKDNPARFEVVAGHTNTKDPGPNIQRSKIKKVVTHPAYPGRLGPNDIAILFLSVPFKWTPFVQKLQIPPAGKEFDGDAWLSGWGSTSTDGRPLYPNVLQKAKVPIISYKDCENFYTSGRLNAESNLCTGPLKGNISGCSGDSGGPLYKEVNGVKYVVGLVSWGRIPCGQGSPTVFTKVSNFVDFIKIHVN